MDLQSPMGSVLERRRTPMAPMPLESDSERRHRHAHEKGVEPLLLVPQTNALAAAAAAAAATAPVSSRAEEAAAWSRFAAACESLRAPRTEEMAAVFRVPPYANADHESEAISHELRRRESLDPRHNRLRDCPNSNHSSRWSYLMAGNKRTQT